MKSCSSIANNRLHVSRKCNYPSETVKDMVKVDVGKRSAASSDRLTPCQDSCVQQKSCLIARLLITSTPIDEIPFLEDITLPTGCSFILTRLEHGRSFGSTWEGQAW